MKSGGETGSLAASAYYKSDRDKAGKTIGGYLNKLVKSDGWKAFQQTSRELRNLPTNLMREANQDLAETEKDIRKSMDMRATPPASISNRGLPLPQGTENSIQPPPATHPLAAGQAAVPEGESNTEEDGGGSTSDVSTPNQNA